MESIVHSVVTGMIAAVSATAILGCAKCVRQWLAKRQDEKYLRDLLSRGRKRVMESKSTYHKGMDANSSADALRAAQYNNMIKRLDIAMEQWLVNLSHDQRKDIFDALDWYHTDSLQAIKRNGNAVFIDIPDGRWPTAEMPVQMSKEIFEKLQSIKWLKLKDKFLTE